MYLAIDLGGTNIKLSLFEKAKEVPVWTKSIPAHSDKGIIQALDRVEEALELEGITDITRVGIATPGIVDSTNCRLTSINDKYADAVDFIFTDWCMQKFGCSLVMENDANAALLGEVSYGCAKGCQNAVMMILGTGIGTSAVINGKVLHGAHNQAGIMGGHFVIHSGGKKCSCGGFGCLEAYGGAREIQKALEQEDRSQSMLKDSGHPGMKEVAAAWKQGDKLASYIMQNQIQLYSDGIINLIHAYDPELVILSGGIMNAGEELKEAIEKQVSERAWAPWGKINFVTAQNPDYSVTYGLLKLMQND